MPLLDPIPSPVLDADFIALEWEPLLALVSGFAASPVGRQAILDLKPSSDEAWIALQHQLTGELRLLLEELTSIPVGGLFDPPQHAAKAQIPGAALEANELITAIRFPIPEKAAYVKFANPASRYALVGVFVAKTGQGVRVAVTGAGAGGVFRVPAFEAALSANFSASALDGLTVDASELASDMHADSDYRAHLIGVLAMRAVAAAG